jgi:hypothetical protein
MVRVAPADPPDRMEVVVPITVFCPVPADAAPPGRLAARVSALTGVRLGFLGNLKPNADVLLQATRALAMQAGVASTLFREKDSCSLGATPEVLDEIAASCDAAVVALADCGSCTSWAIHDSVELDRRGVPTVTFVAEPFLPLAKHEARGLGVPDLRLALLPYPMSGVPSEEVARRADAAFDDVIAGLSGATAGHDG